MEYLILGLLSLSPMTGYELQQFIRQNLSLICSSSAGSVQAALSKLVCKGFISASENTQGRRKKTFSITQEGRTAFSGWIAHPMEASKVKNMQLTHLFFLGLAHPSERIGSIHGYISQIEESKSVLLAVRQRFYEIQNNTVKDTDQLDTVFRFQGYTIEYGIAAADFELNWYRSLLKKEENT